MQRINPPYRADHVGSLLRPAALKEARIDREIEKAIHRQQEVGLQSITDGEFRRSWWNLDFLAGFDGTEWVQLSKGIQFKGVTTRAEGVRVSGKLGFTSHPMIPAVDGKW